MRKIDAQIVSAIRNRRNFTRGAYEVIMTLSPREGFEFSYRGALIVWAAGGKVYASLRGWDTPTTRGKINAICTAFGLDAGLHRNKGVTYLACKTHRRPLDPNEIFQIGVM